MLPERKKIISLEISTGRYSDFVDRIIELAKKRQSSYVCVSNVHMVIEAYDDKDFARQVNAADLVTPDGMTLVHAMKLLYGVRQDRVAGMDLMPSLLHELQKTNQPLFFYGGSQQALDKTAEFMAREYPGLTKVGYHSPPFRALSEEEEKETVEMINNSGAELVFVVLGCPKQERWMAKHKGKINACMVGIGGALPVLIGEQKRAPMWMQKISMEWFFRFLQEPRRLFKRYFYTNNKFLILLFGAWLRKIFRKA